MVQEHGLISIVYIWIYMYTHSVYIVFMYVHTYTYVYTHMSNFQYLNLHVACKSDYLSTLDLYMSKMSKQKHV